MRACTLLLGEPHQAQASDLSLATGIVGHLDPLPSRGSGIRDRARSPSGSLRLEAVMSRRPVLFRVRPIRAGAYCGQGHGAGWDFVDPEHPPDTVDLPECSEGRYRLVCHLRTRRLVTDRMGNLVYLAESELMRRTPTTRATPCVDRRSTMGVDRAQLVGLLTSRGDHDNAQRVGGSTS